MEEPITYVVAHLHEALLRDERLYEQGIEIVVVGDRLALRGEVATPERRDAAVALVHQLVPDIELVDDLCVSSPVRGGEQEAL